jgi:hypothetical protein
MFGRSPWDGTALECLHGRGASIVVVGRPIPGAVLRIPFHRADHPLVAALVEVSVTEPAAATWWRRRVDAGQMP